MPAALSLAPLRADGQSAIQPPLVWRMSHANPLKVMGGGSHEEDANPQGRADPADHCLLLLAEPLHLRPRDGPS